jgi:hypothetical protein
MKPLLDKLELPQVQELVTLERRVLAEHKPPGMEGSLLQNMGRRPLRLSLWGIAIGPDARTFVEKLDTIFRNDAPVPFTADIVADAGLEKVVVEDLRVQDLAGKPERFAYVVVLREHIDPVQPEDTSAVDTAALDDATNLLGDMLPGLTGGLDFLTGLERFVAPLSQSLSQIQQFNSALAGR